MHPTQILRNRRRPCKQCGEEFTPKRPLQVVCKLSCALADSREKAVVEAAKIEAKRQRERKIALKPRSKWLQEAQDAVNAYVRVRDRDEPCISCQRHHTGQYHAGHYRSVGAMPSLRFNLYNLAKQCSACNNNLSGNLIAYRVNLIAKIGAGRVAWIEGPHPVRSFDIVYLRRIRKIFIKRAKHLARLRGVA
jgi:Bacteriophage Lambda NinG protein